MKEEEEPVKAIVIRAVLFLLVIVNQRVLLKPQVMIAIRFGALAMVDGVAIPVLLQVGEDVVFNLFHRVLSKERTLIFKIPIKNMYKKNSRLFFVFSVLVMITTFSCRGTDNRYMASFSKSDSFQKDTIFLYNGIKNAKRITFFRQDDLNKYAFPITIKSNDNQSIKKIISSDTLVLVEGYKYTPFVIFPGETITAKENKNGNIILEVTDDSVRNNELLFFVKLDEIIPWPFASPKKIAQKEDFLNRERVYKSAYNNSINFLDAFSRERKISEQFYNFAKRYLYYKYLMFLFNPSFYSKTHDLRDLFSQYKFNFQKDENIIVPTYNMAAYNYSLLLLEQKDTKITFEEHFNVIKKYFQFNTQKFLLYRTLINNIDKEASKPEYKKSVAFFLEKYSTDTLCKIFTKNFDYLNNNPSFLQNTEYQNENLLNPDGKFLSWKEMLRLYNGKIIYIDFWATWCGPCIGEFPYSEKLKTQFRSQDIVFVYISSDVEKSKWLDALNEFGINSYGENYLLTVPDNSLIKNAFLINSIPRYMIFDKNGKLVDKDALRPSNSKLLPILLKLMR